MIASVTSAPTFLSPSFWPAVVNTLVFGGIGILLALVGFKLFDLITPRIDVQRELAEKQNLAVALVCAAIILGVCYLVAAVVH